MSSAEYIHCNHQYCFAITIGKPGDLCDECHTEDQDAQERECGSCDNDSWGHEPQEDNSPSPVEVSWNYNHGTSR